MKYILSMIFLSSCCLLSEEVMEDVVEGEANVAYKAAEDILKSPRPHSFTNPQ